MCGRFTQHHSGAEISERFDAHQLSLEDLAEFGELRPRFNIAPTQYVPVVVPDPEGGRRLRMMRWGLIPRWAKDPTIGSKMINARAETLAEKPAFKPALARRRCLVPADGFYEWFQEGGQKTPMYIRRRDAGLFALAGLWEEWKDPSGRLVPSFTVVTTAANKLLRSIHDRMPAILEPDEEQDWLEEPNLHLLRPYPDRLLEAFPVSRRVNSPGVDEPGLIEPARRPGPLAEATLPL